MALEHNKAELMIKHNEIRNDLTQNIIDLNDKFESEKKCHEIAEIELNNSIHNIDNELIKRTNHFEYNNNEQNKIMSNNEIQLEQLNKMLVNTLQEKVEIEKHFIENRGDYNNFMVRTSDETNFELANNDNKINQFVIEHDNEERERNQKIEEVKDINLVNKELDNEVNKKSIQIDRISLEYNQYKSDSEAVKKIIRSTKIRKRISNKNTRRKIIRIGYFIINK